MFAKPLGVHPKLQYSLVDNRHELNYDVISNHFFVWEYSKDFHIWCIDMYYFYNPSESIKNEFLNSNKKLINQVFSNENFDS